MSVDLTAILANLSSILPSVNAFIGAFSYVWGIIFCVLSFIKFKELLGDSGGQQPKTIVPVAYFLAGAGMLFLPSMIDTFSMTLFGTGYNILSYSPANQSNINNSIQMLIQTAGFIWFIRGCVLLAHASHPEQGQEGSKGLGPKGFIFIVASLFAINIQSTWQMVNYIVNHLISLSSGYLGG